MSSASQSADRPIELERAERLKRQLVEFATGGPLKEEYDRQHKLFFELSDQKDEREAESVLDWFLFDWFDENGESTIDHFLDSQPGLSEDDQEVLYDWEDSINSVFEIRSIGKNSLRLHDLDSGDTFPVSTSASLEESPFSRGQFIAARLLPLGDKFIFSGLQFIMPDRDAAMEALEMRRALDALNSPEALENAQREQCSAFCELFGCEELSIPSKELNSVLERFQRYLFAERRDPQTGLTSAERFRSEFGRELTIPDMPPLPEELIGVGEVTILCDDFDGIVLLPDFNRFKKVFESDHPDKSVPDWRDIVWNYIKNPDIPIVAFERMAEVAPVRVEKRMQDLLDDSGFSIEHLYAVLLHYKQPVDGFEDLVDDQRLWDMLNGNTQTNGRSARTSSEAGPKKAPGKAAAVKTASSRKKKPAARKTTQPVSRTSSKSKPAAKARARTSTGSKAKSTAKVAKGAARSKAAAGKSGTRKVATRKARASKSAPAKKR